MPAPVPDPHYADLVDFPCPECGSMIKDGGAEFYRCGACELTCRRRDGLVGTLYAPAMALGRRTVVAHAPEIDSFANRMRAKRAGPL